MTERRLTTRAVAANLPAEESPLELPRLGGREPRLREYLHDLIRDLPQFWRKWRRMWVPAQTVANVLVEPRIRGCELVSESVQLAYLLEQRLELHGFDGHDRRIRIEESLARRSFR